MKKYLIIFALATSQTLFALDEYCSGMFQDAVAVSRYVLKNKQTLEAFLEMANNVNDENSKMKIEEAPKWLGLEEDSSTTHLYRGTYYTITLVGKHNMVADGKETNKIEYIKSSLFIHMAAIPDNKETGIGTYQCLSFGNEKSKLVINEENYNEFINSTSVF